ncbi:MAG: hemerythrin domain-containing protein [Melioribacteraceae bacterium]|nr:hemerythrin domain-containing protein [Melioribacteraceae bacterium]MCF8262974.1 hemerythrin domain-containing protein [Melioribacteraceae bacterium]MCF8430593.1 hemerythrin domain-containing protein [Melioribacteraceae bacterium]
MRRSKTLIPLSHDHHHGLRLAALLKNIDIIYENLPNDTRGKIEYTKDAWENELNIHFENEEQILFPAVKGKNKEIDSLIDELLVEHVEIKTAIADLNNNSDAENQLIDLGNKIENHIRKEERILFDKIQEQFSESELKKIVGEIIPVKKYC